MCCFLRHFSAKVLDLSAFWMVTSSTLRNKPLKLVQINTQIWPSFHLPKPPTPRVATTSRSFSVRFSYSLETFLSRFGLGWSSYLQREKDDSSDPQKVTFHFSCSLFVSELVEATDQFGEGFAVKGQDLKEVTRFSHQILYKFS